MPNFFRCLLPICCLSLPHSLAATFVHDVPHDLRRRVALPQHPLPRAEAQHPRRVARQLVALGEQQGREDVHLVEEATAVLEVRRLPAEAFFECPLVYGKHHGVLERLRRGHLPRVVEELELPTAVPPLQRRYGLRILRGPQFLHVHLLLALGLRELHDDLSLDPGDAHLVHAAHLAGQARAHDDACHRVADLEGRLLALGGDHLRVPSHEPVPLGHVRDPEALRAARLGGGHGPAATARANRLREGRAGPHHGGEELLLAAEALSGRRARHHCLHGLVVAAGHDAGDQLEGSLEDDEELGGDLAALQDVTAPRHALALRGAREAPRRPGIDVHTCAEVGVLADGLADEGLLLLRQVLPVVYGPAQREARLHALHPLPVLHDAPVVDRRPLGEAELLVEAQPFELLARH
mmetsp:Transcript_115942/g.361149  ORF Transcript_115942/g.361149 Transcript_115942/m.361149 type:complete len:409 (-) Transcript_115942:540-1766(-)